MNSVESIALEPLAVRSENVVSLPLGLLGFERIKRYALLQNPQEAPFRWLQVLDDPNLAFLVLSPFLALPDYEPDVANEDVEFLEASSPEDVLLFSIVTLRPNGSATINLKGPIAINRLSLKGKQVVLTNAARYSIEHPLPVDPEP